MTDLPTLRREPADAQIAGVCAALAREWGIDPVLVRLGFVAAAVVTNGIAIAAYLIGWALIPQRGAVVEPIRALLPFTRDWSRTTLVLAVVAVTLGGIVVTGAGPGALVVFGIIWLVLRQARRRRPTVTDAPPSPPRHAPTTDFERLSHAWQQRLDNVDAGRPPEWDPPSAAPPFGAASAPPGRRRAAAARRRRGWRTWFGIVGVLALAWGYLGALVALGVAVPGLAWAAATLAVLSVSLLLVARPSRAVYGRPAGLVLATVVSAAVTLGLMAAVSPVPRAAGEAPRAFETADLQRETALDSGQQTVDLRGVRVAASQTVTYRQDLGTLTVWIPETGNVRVEASVDLGSLDTPDGSSAGIENKLVWERVDDPEAPVLTVRAVLDLGHLEVRA